MSPTLLNSLIPFVNDDYTDIIWVCFPKNMVQQIWRQTLGSIIFWDNTKPLHLSNTTFAFASADICCMCVGEPRQWVEKWATTMKLLHPQLKRDYNKEWEDWHLMFGLQVVLVMQSMEDCLFEQSALKSGGAIVVMKHIEGPRYVIPPCSLEPQLRHNHSIAPHVFEI